MKQNELKKHRSLIVGFGQTGRAVAEFFQSHKIPFDVYDDKTQDLKGFDESVHLFQEPSQIHLELEVKKWHFVFISPGVSQKHPVIRALKGAQIPIYGDVELASWFLQAEFIAVTGTNGKSTTVRLIHDLLNDVGIQNQLKGNIGSPLITAVEDPPSPYLVIEESSFQLEWIGSVRHKISVCLNVTHDHMDRYDSFEDYAKAKSLIFKNSTQQDFFIYNADDPACAKMAKDCLAQTVPFSLVNHFEDNGAFVDHNDMVFRLDGKEYRFDLTDCALVGLHNQENMLASLLCCLLIQNDAHAILSYRKTLQHFHGLAHRLQNFLTVSNIQFFDDSKATNVGSVVMALASFENNVILLLGGHDKDMDFEPLKAMADHKVKHLICFGAAKEKLKSVFSEHASVKIFETLKEASVAAVDLAEEGDTVLLSPGCASFDEFQNYAERGDYFQAWVKEAVDLHYG